MAENRYFQMIYLLLEKGGMTAPELAKHFEVSVRTIYRDIDILSGSGIPVYAMQGKGGGIFIQENFVLNKSLISEQEQQQILMALQGLDIVETENTNALFSKLSGIFQKQNMNWIEVDFSGWVKNHADNDDFEKLKRAIFQNRKVSFTYYSGKGEAISRAAEPLKLIFKSKDWFMYGYCCLREDFRFFKLTRIKELEITSEEYSRSVPAKIIQQTDNYFEDTIPVILKFDKEMSFRIYDEFPNKVIRNEDGSFLIETHLPNNERLYSYLFSFGDKIELLSPQYIREEVQTRLKNMHSKYIT